MEHNAHLSKPTPSHTINLNPEQTEALAAIAIFRKSADHIFILNGAAGTGKTTLIRSLCQQLTKEKTRFHLTATTGRAAKVLAARSGFAAITLHSLLYLFDEVSGEAKEGEDPWKTGSGQLFLQFGLRQTDLNEHPEVIIIDEASMISHLPATEGNIARFGSGNLLFDLLTFAGKSKIIFVGDSCQLPPVAELSLSAALSTQYWEAQQITAHEFTLTQIVRQQQDNEILEVATGFRSRIEQPRSARLLRLPPPKARNVFATDEQEGFLGLYFNAVKEYSLTQTVAICHSNMQAHHLNTQIRSQLHGRFELQAGDLLMVVQNSYNTDLVNGDQVTVKEVHFEGMRAGFSFSRVKVVSLFENKEYETLLVNDLLYNANPSLSSEEVKRLLLDFDDRMRRQRITRNSEMYKNRMKEDGYLNALRAKYGYALTVHKAQGGEWNAVFLYLNKSIYSMVYHPNGGGRHPDGADRYHRWFYTAITRAKEKLVVNECQFVQESW